MDFPLLKTGAVAQYGSDRRREFSTQVYRFVDGAEQRFPGFGAVLRRWVIRLELLDEAELLAVQELFVNESSFSFTDPWDGVVYPNCRFEGDEMSAEFARLGKATVMISEIR
jgi:hypothetical protein